MALLGKLCASGHTVTVSATIIHPFSFIVNAYFSVFGAARPDFFVRFLRRQRPGQVVRKLCVVVFAPTRPVSFYGAREDVGRGQGSPVQGELSAKLTEGL